MKARCWSRTTLLTFILSFFCFQLFILGAYCSDNQETYGYRISDNPPRDGYVLEKEWQESESYHYLAKFKGETENFGSSKIIKNIHMIVSFHTENNFQIKILDNDNERWQIPEEFPFPHYQSNKLISASNGCCSIEVQKDPFTFFITRKDTGEIIFDTRGKDFVYSDFYIRLSTNLPTDNVYGFGERNYKFKLSPGIYTIWGRDDPKILETAKGGGNTYSHHPVGLLRDKKGNFFLTLMRNVNAMDVIVDSDSLTYKMVGGVIDLVFFVGNDYPESVLINYHNYIGTFTMMPFWSLGFHQSKWGYTNYRALTDIVTQYISHDIPLDVIWSDIDYMIEKEIFTVDTGRFPPEKIKELTSNYKKKWVPIIDPGVKQKNPRGPGLEEGLKRDIFLKNYQGKNLIGYVWPGDVHFPDFFHPDASAYWSDMLEHLYNIVPFAGIWLDMNEVANFVDGESPKRNPNDYHNLDLPYNPGLRPLNNKTISLDAVHYGGILEFDAHGLFSILEIAATHKYLETKSKLPFILTRANTMGVGRFSAHWSGDNGAYWEYLKYSIPGNFNFQIFGIPFVGADICGFMDKTNEELCARWTQLGALYPFARNHHEEKTNAHQEPWAFKNTNLGVSLVETARIALKTRYSILKWYYSLFIEKRGAGSIFKPLMFEFPHEEILYQDGYSDWEFLLGRGVLCTPKVESGEPFVHAYFPKANWFDLSTGKRVINEDVEERVLRVETPFNAPVPLFLRAGHILHRQSVDRVLSTEDLNDEFELIVALGRENENGMLSAKGSIMGIQSFDDDSVYHRCMEDNCLYDIVVTVLRDEGSSLTVEVKFKRQSDDMKVPLESLGFYGLKLYGLPLEFMTEDESRIGYALVQFVKGDHETSVPDLKKLIEIENNAFWVEFGTSLRIQDGDSLKLELII